jgi:rhamnogalacturonyl hydrolase YesR
MNLISDLGAKGCCWTLPGLNERKSYDERAAEPGGAGRSPDRGGYVDGYIGQEESIRYKFGKDHKGILAAISSRFIGNNPPTPLVFRTFHTGGIPCDTFGQYLFHYSERFQGQNGKFAYAFGKLWSENTRNSNFSILCSGLVRVYLNKVLVFDSTVVSGDCDRGMIKTGRLPMEKRTFPVKLERGWNAFFLRFERTEAGFGCKFGNAMPQWEPCNFHAPFAERDGRTGFVFTEPLEEEVFGDANIPGLDSTEASTGVKWLPDGTWPEESVKLPPVCRLFGGSKKGFVYAWTSIERKTAGIKKIKLAGTAFSSIKIWVGGDLFCFESGDFLVEKELGFGKHDILVECSRISGRPTGFVSEDTVSMNDVDLVAAAPEKGLPGNSLPEPGRWGFRMKNVCEDEPLEFIMPGNIKGCSDPWLYLGIFDEVPQENTGELKDLYRLFTTSEHNVYWRVDEKDTVVRPFAENALYGRWTYPLGVTLYGLLHYGEYAGREDILEYVRTHVGLVVKIHEYTLYDKQQFGYPGVNHQIAWLDALDDCGSFGSLMLECSTKWYDPKAERIAGIIADHMMNRQIRREDGAYYRDNDTMWVDDLYMSVPFLRRYWQLTGKGEYLDEACRQLLLFEKYLFMKDHNIMSHIYSFSQNRPNNIPWSRGNGWAVFSITELLEILPAGHKDFEQITDLYNRLVTGIIRLQGENGLWHQVLNREDTYEEASSTAMFLCSFVRGITKGYIRPELLEKAAQSAFKAWDGLTARAIDYQGNIYGVCRGSGFSFSSDYYRDLSWNYNDTHGIGIILLAGTEIMRLEAYLQKAPGR